MCRGAVTIRLKASHITSGGSAVSGAHVHRLLCLQAAVAIQTGKFDCVETQSVQPVGLVPG